ncbi:flagellar basal-body rod protein FlgG [Ferrimonas balearica DSM 9799]|uniref:Flagellar basal-body rod protein FlgG n=1 Tax=Ferrimonas balearica (strain DSM 9799 / CCM 4581 / KCTC 23876 / PAT) TaxID=550540 RepID=E1SLF0_FERBD|nr:flagellar basal-body rod protein FlgG [Ferrimonas balearica]ADN76514.1 flagellar basal-body rod protein FlgG [Ferrimonas balearica DSM 9799]MBW3139414.1 flagellar basal-body rod protein FlgG [Ferrimonas balearica]MBW3162997.1 flagellar basal-body rod protein FlgG [Ferrimonas balearica]MBY5980689.1 flagellar basal-body rod protein FlgG [Ferrimonas balearica]MBY6106482.1 flagellar basal-body rod protein FlgG [Ferrimonas balearica]
MQSALWVSKTGLTAQDTKMTTIANNLANVNTTGFKRDRVSFNDLFYQTQRQPGAMADQQNELPSGLQLGTGVRITGTQKVFTTGDIITTNQPLDLAIMGQGFFQVEQPNGDFAYTRDGQFYRNADGLVVTSEGMPLVPAVEIPEDALTVTVGSDGIVTAQIAGDAVPQELGQITLANFTNPAGLEAFGNNLYRETAASGVAIEGIPGDAAIGQLKQGTLEGANVNVVEEMVEMISTQRAYEMNAKVVSSTDDMLKYLNQVL